MIQQDMEEGEKREVEASLGRIGLLIYLKINEGGYQEQNNLFEKIIKQLKINESGDFSYVINPDSAIISLSATSQDLIGKLQKALYDSTMDIDRITEPGIFFFPEDGVTFEEQSF